MARRKEGRKERKERKEGGKKEGRREGGRKEGKEGRKDFCLTFSTLCANSTDVKVTIFS